MLSSSMHSWHTGAAPEQLTCCILSQLTGRHCRITVQYNTIQYDNCTESLYNSVDSEWSVQPLKCTCAKTMDTKLLNIFNKQIFHCFCSELLGLMHTHTVCKQKRTPYFTLICCAQEPKRQCISVHVTELQNSLFTCNLVQKRGFVNTLTWM